MKGGWFWRSGRVADTPAFNGKQTNKQTNERPVSGARAVLLISLLRGSCVSFGPTRSIHHLVPSSRLGSLTESGTIRPNAILLSALAACDGLPITHDLPTEALDWPRGYACSGAKSPISRVECLSRQSRSNTSWTSSDLLQDASTKSRQTSPSRWSRAPLRATPCIHGTSAYVTPPLDKLEVRPESPSAPDSRL